MEKTCSRIDPVTQATCPNEPSANHPWCKACKAKYQREYEALKGGMATVRGFSRGVEALRDVLGSEFERLGSGSFNGYEIAHLIRQTPSPRYAEE